MKVIDALKHKGRPFEIPDSGRPGLLEFFKDMNFTVGAEIGVSKGFFSKQICDAGFKLYAVDPWADYSDYHKDGWKEEMDRQYRLATALLAPYPTCTIIRKTSMEAVKDFADGSLDFVYIDANHGFKFVTEDIFEWTKKVRKGGVISGHDFIYTKRDFDNVHVKYVVNAYTRAFGINPWYILRPTGHEKADKFASWMWIK